MQFVLSTLVQVLILLFVVPSCTGGGVKIKGHQFLQGLLAVCLICLLNSALWIIISVMTVGMALIFQWLTFGVVGLLINALAIKLTGRVMGDAFQVRSYAAALGAAVILVLSNLAIQHFLSYT